MNARASSAAVLALSGAVMLLWWLLPPPRSHHRAPEGFIRESYESAGEILFHGLASDRAAVSHFMPMASLTAGLLADHSGLSQSALRAASQLAGCSLVVALALLLQPLVYGTAPAALLLLFLAERGDVFHYCLEAGYAQLLLVAAGLLVWRGRTRTAASGLLAACAVGATLLYRSPLAFFPPLLAWADRAWPRRGSSARSWKQTAALCLVPYLFLLPWIGLNWILYHRLIPFENGEANCNIATGALGLVQTVDGDWTTLIDAQLDPAQPSAVLLWAAREVAGHPLRYLLAIALRLRFVLLLHPLLFALALGSVVVHRARTEHRMLALLAFYFIGIHCLMPVEERYFKPLWPLLAVLGASALTPFIKPSAAKLEPAVRRPALGAMLAALTAALASSCLAWIAAGAYAGRALREGQSSDGTLSRALGEYPRDRWLLRERGRRRLELGDAPGAVEDLAAASPTGAAQELDLAWARSLAGDPVALTRWRWPAPDDPEGRPAALRAHLLIADERLRQGRRSEARANLEAALRTYLDMVQIRGAASARNESLLQRLRADRRDFVRRALAPIQSRPADEQRKFLAALIELLPDDESLRARQAALLAQSVRQPGRPGL